MAEKQGTIADIIAEKRRRAEVIERDCAEKMKRGEMVSDCYARELVADIRREADRLEAAYKREKAAIEADALAVGGIVEAARKRERGNCAKLREALGKLRAELWNNTVIAGKRKFELYEIADAALAEPPRNCDALSAQEQTEKFNQFCQSHRNSDLPKCAGCPLEDIPDGTGCAQAWGQMPYESEAAK